MNLKLSAAVIAAALMAPLAAQAQAPAGKKELVAKVLQLMTPSTEAFAQQMALQPAMQIQQGAGAALQRVPAERREALARDIEADLRKYAEDVVPLARARATKLAPTTMGAVIEERFTEEELRQVVALLESPVNRKFQQAVPEMHKALTEKMVAELRPEIEGKARALDQTIAKRLGITPPAASAPASAGGKK